VFGGEDNNGVFGDGVKNRCLIFLHPDARKKEIQEKGGEKSDRFWKKTGKVIVSPSEYFIYFSS